MIVLKSLTFQITVEDDGVYKDIVQLPLGIGRGKLVEYSEIDSVKVSPSKNLMAEYVSPIYQYFIPLLLILSDSSTDILTDDNRYFGADIEGMVHIERTDGTEVRLSSRNATEMASAVRQRQAKRSDTTVKSVA